MAVLSHLLIQMAPSSYSFFAKILFAFVSISVAIAIVFFILPEYKHEVRIILREFIRRIF